MLPRRHTLQAGYTLVELIVVITLTLIIALAFYTFFKTNLITYLNLQTDASNFTDLAQQSQRVATVVRGATDITSAGANDLTMYAYFYPSDAYTSQVRYYLSSDGTQLYADVTPMTANPPIGTLITSKKKTYTIISSFRQSSGASLFTYLDASGTALSLPIADLHTIKAVQTNLGVATSSKGINQAMTVQVGLRNRKTNL